MSGQSGTTGNAGSMNTGTGVNLNQFVPQDYQHLQWMQGQPQSENIFAASAMPNWDLYGNGGAWANGMKPYPVNGFPDMTGGAGGAGTGGTDQTGMKPFGGGGRDFATNMPQGLQKFYQNRGYLPQGIQNKLPTDFDYSSLGEVQDRIGNGQGGNPYLNLEQQKARGVPFQYQDFLQSRRGW